MAHQYIAQLESWDKSGGGKADVKAAVFGNCWYDTVIQNMVLLMLSS
jgi:hypothetical protein